MRSKISELLVFTTIFLMLNSCQEDDATIIIAKWKAENDSYFINMKDSSDYNAYIIPAERGGGGFYYKVTNAGDQNSMSPLSSSMVKVNYRGKLITGEVFDETYKGLSPLNESTSKPIEFLNYQLIPGWTENLMQMKVGEIRTVVLPYQLAYGSQNLGIIKPFSTLVFDIQLISYR